MRKIIEMNEHECQCCGVRWVDSGEPIVFCYECAEELA